RVVELFDLVGRQLSPVVGQPEQKQQQIDVDALLVLQRNAGVGDASVPVKMQREAPERRGLGLPRRIVHFSSKYSSGEQPVIGAGRAQSGDDALRRQRRLGKVHAKRRQCVLDGGDD